MYSKAQKKALATVQQGVKNYGPKQLASDLGVTTQTLYADVDPKSLGRRTNKLGFLDWLVILETSNDMDSLEEVNALFNRLTLPIPIQCSEVDNTSWMSHCANVAKESGEAVSVLAEAILDGDMDKTDLEKNEKEALDALYAFGGLYLAIKEARQSFGSGTNTDEAQNGKESLHR